MGNIENIENTENTESRLEQMLLIGSFDGWELITDITDDYPDQTWLTFEKGVGVKGSEDIMKYHTSVCVTPEPKYNTLEKTNEFRRVFARYLEYDTSWDSLMPVIRQIGFLKSSPEVLLWIRNNKTIFDLDLTDVYIEVYLETVKFIRWYSDYNKPSI